MSRRRLDRELVARGLAASADQAREVIEGKQVVLDGTIALNPSSLVLAAAIIEISGLNYRSAAVASAGQNGSNRIHLGPLINTEREPFSGRAVRYSSVPMPQKNTPEPSFFETSDQLRKWLERDNGKTPELWIGFYKTASKKGGITYKDALDQARRFGWIDGVRKSLDDSSYTIRFTPRKRGSNWSAVNIKRVGELTKLGLMAPAGVAAFKARDPSKDHSYSYEQSLRKLAPEHEKEFKKNKEAWAFFQVQAPSYQRITSWFVMSAKKDETRRRRLAQLIAESNKGRRLDPLRPMNKDR